MQSKDSPAEAFPHTAVEFAQTGGLSKEKIVLCFSNKCNPTCSKECITAGCKRDWSDLFTSKIHQKLGGKLHFKDSDPKVQHGKDPLE